MSTGLLPILDSSAKIFKEPQDWAGALHGKQRFLFQVNEPKRDHYCHSEPSRNLREPRLKSQKFNQGVVRRKKTFQGVDYLQIAFAMKLCASKISAASLPHPQRRLLIASRIKDAREQSGLSQRDVARRLHIGQSTYCRMERGEGEPSAAQIATLSGLYGLSVLWLLGMPNYFVYIDQSSSSSSS